MKNGRNGNGQIEKGEKQKLLFEFGRIVCTPGAIEAFKASTTHWLDPFNRHLEGDWGDLGDEDKARNDLSVKDGARIFSAYILPDTGVKIWIITEADRSATTLLLPDEY